MATSSCHLSVFLLFSACFLLLVFSSSFLVIYPSTPFDGIISKLNTTQIFQRISLDGPPSQSTHITINHSRKSWKRGLIGVEADLASAREAIQKAVRTKRYTSDKEESFAPRGCVYRNAYAFHQSHIEMTKRFKIWVYKEGEMPLVHGGPMKDIYSIEGQFMGEMEFGESPFIAGHPDEAHAFFLPVSVAQIVEYIYMPITTHDRDRLVRIVKDYVQVVANKHSLWNRSNGADHFIVGCHDWAPDISQNETKLFKNLIKVICNANTSEGFQPIRDVSMPNLNTPPFHLNPPFLGLASEKRNILAFFSGGAHGHIREALLEHWKDKETEVLVHEYLPKAQNYMKLMGHSKFCLCPSGFEVASPRVVDSILSGCVPVIISDHYSLPFSDVLDWSKFSVQIPKEKIPEIKVILQGIRHEKYLKMQDRVMRVRSHFVLNRPAKPFDIIHMILHCIWLRRLNIRLSY